MTCKLIRDASFFLFDIFSEHYKMCRLDSSLSIVLTWVHLCLPMALMKNLVSVFERGAGGKQQEGVGRFLAALGASL